MLNSTILTKLKVLKKLLFKLITTDLLQAANYNPLYIAVLNKKGRHLLYRPLENVENDFCNFYSGFAAFAVCGFTSAPTR